MSGLTPSLVAYSSTHVEVNRNNHRRAANCNYLGYVVVIQRSLFGERLVGLQTSGNIINIEIAAHARSSGCAYNVP